MSPPAERIVAGISCREVLAVLSDFLDGEIDRSTRERVVAHVGGCDVCERFGDEFAKMIAAVRRRLHDPSTLPADVARRLAERLAGAD